MREKDKVRKKLGKKQPAIDDFRCFQPVQIAMDAKMRKFSISKVYSGERSKSVAGQLYFESL